MMALVHDLAEAQGKQNYLLNAHFESLTYELRIVGDIAPQENIPKAEKRRLETVRFHLILRPWFTG